MHLVILTRADPPLSLPSLRARNQLTELRAADLRFTPDEAAVFLNTTMGLELPAEYIAALEERTEGWIAGLQLAALSMQGRDDMQDFVSAFTGSQHYIVDYLVEAVLNCQSKTVREFLLKTSILDRLTASLCHALTNRTDGQTVLDILEHANLFVIPLDDEQRWYCWQRHRAGRASSRSRRVTERLEKRGKPTRRSPSVSCSVLTQYEITSQISSPNCRLPIELKPLSGQGMPDWVKMEFKSTPHQKVENKTSTF